MTIDQPELPLEWSEVPEHYVVEVRHGPQFDEAEVLRTHTVKDATDALGLIEGLRDTFNSRYDVSWQTDEPNAHGLIYGLAPGGEVYILSVSPPLP